MGNKSKVESVAPGIINSQKKTHSTVAPARRRTDPKSSIVQPPRCPPHGGQVVSHRSRGFIGLFEVLCFRHLEQGSMGSKEFILGFRFCEKLSFYIHAVMTDHAILSIVINLIISEHLSHGKPKSEG